MVYDSIMTIDIKQIRADRKAEMIAKHGTLRHRSPRMTIDRSNPALVFSIRTYEDFLAAIVDSWSGSPVYSTYQLETDLTFDETYIPYIGTGNSDEDFLTINPGQTFDGKGFTMTLVHGCEPAVSWTDNGYLPSIIIYAGGVDPDAPAIIQNVSIVVEEEMQFTYLLSYECSYAIFRNISIISHASTFLYSQWLFDYGENITMDSISIVSTQPLTSISYLGLIGYVGGTANTLTNSFFIAPSIDQYTYMVGGAVDIGSTFEASNVYVYLSNQDTIVTGVAGVFYGNSNDDCTTTLTDIYVVYNTFSEIQSLNVPIMYYNDVTDGVVNYENVYTNNDNDTIPYPGGDVNGSITTNFLWTNQPVFSSDAFDKSSPNRLMQFLSFPFNASSYPLFDYPALMLQSITSIPDALVATRTGTIDFLYRLTNPNLYAPTPRVITNEYIVRRDLNPNPVPSRNGFVV